MSELKTKVNDGDVHAFLDAVADDRKRRDAYELLDMFMRVTGEPPKMWGGSIVGFGRYHYKSERSSQEGDWPLTAFSPRKANLSIYVMNGFETYMDLMTRLGKHKTGVGCLYVNKLEDVDRGVLEELITRSYRDMQALHPSDS